MSKIMSSCVLATVATLSAGSANACSKVMKMALEQWPPYVYTDGKKQAAGVDIELVKVIFAEARCTIVFEGELPRKRRLAVFMDGGIDLMLAASDTPERREYSWFSVPYRNESVSLFTKPSNFNRYRNIDGFSAILLRKISLLSPSAGWYGDEYKKYFYSLNEANLVSPFETFVQGVRMFAANRTELIMGDTGALIYEAQQQKVPIAVLPFAVVNAPVHFMFSKKSVTEADVAAITQAIERLEQRGVLNKIRQQYGLY